MPWTVVVGSVHEVRRQEGAEQRLPVRVRRGVGHRDRLAVGRALDGLDVRVAVRGQHRGASTVSGVAAVVGLPREREVVGGDRRAVAPHGVRVDRVGVHLLAAGAVQRGLLREHVRVVLDREVRLDVEGAGEHAADDRLRRGAVARRDEGVDVLREAGRLTEDHPAGTAVGGVATASAVASAARCQRHRAGDTGGDEHRAALAQLHVRLPPRPACAGGNDQVWPTREHRTGLGTCLHTACRTALSSLSTKGDGWTLGRAARGSPRPSPFCDLGSQPSHG
jgi:hypothetical protein